MHFGWINGVNAAAVACLIAVNLIANAKGIAGSFQSQNKALNLLEQLGRYACIVLMIFPVGTAGWKFGFRSVPEMFAWLGLTLALLAVYIGLWFRKKNGGAGILYGLAAVPAALFLFNGILLRHWALVFAALVFGIIHLLIVRENTEVLRDGV